jgi:polyisoprenyl-phosphate glycosyltransferase
MSKNKKLLSIIIPIFNEEENINCLYQTLTEICKRLEVFESYELIAVDDGSKDNSLRLLENLTKQDSHLKIVSFTRNFGHEAATTAGLLHARGDAATIIDADLQDPPELFLEFEKEYANGFDIVYGQRTKRHGEPILKKLSSFLFYRFFRWFTNIDMPNDIGDFCLLSRNAIERFKQLPERSRFVRALLYWSGLPKKAVNFVRQERLHGETKQGSYHRITTAIDYLLSFSTIPPFLIILSAMGMGFFSSGLLFTMMLLQVSSLVSFSLVAWLFAFMFLGLSILGSFLGIIAVYIGKIFTEVKARPVFMVGKRINFKEQNYDKKI